MASRSIEAVVTAGTALVVPWSAFVGAFLYYTVLTLLAIGVTQLSDGFMEVAYGLPVGLYGLWLLARATRWVVAALPVHAEAQVAPAFPR